MRRSGNSAPAAHPSSTHCSPRIRPCGPTAPAATTGSSSPRRVSALPANTTSLRTDMPEARSELARALAEFHKTMPDVSMGSTNPHFGSKYADLADIVKVVLPALAAQGLAWITTPTMVDDSFVLRYETSEEHTSALQSLM